jgi:hypothetical protein
MHRYPWRYLWRIRQQREGICWDLPWKRQCQFDSLEDAQRMLAAIHRVLRTRGGSGITGTVTKVTVQETVVTTMQRGRLIADEGLSGQITMDADDAQAIIDAARASRRAHS